ncbi:MAG: DUF2807 domain-containing protein [Robiginitalea sp.]|jgi:hypothetical protein
MKKALIFSVSLLIAFSASAQWGKKIRGNGNMVTEERNVGSYDEVSVSGWFDVELTSGEEGRLTLYGEENLLEYLETEVKNGRLQIKTRPGYNLQSSSWKSGGIRITVPVEDLRAVTMSGSGDIKGKTKLVSDYFEVTMSGSGDMALEIEADQTEVTLSGSGDIDLEGSSVKLEVRVSGSGDVNAYGLSAREVDAVVSGSADIKVTATEYIKARVSGSGDIYYRGNPEKIDTRASGSGDVHKGS